MGETNRRPQVGLTVIIFKDGKILLGKRKNAHGEGEYGVLGGHLEYMESFADCAKRETQEEANIEIENIKFIGLMNLKAYAPKHYVDIGLVANWKSGEPKVMEPHKLESWGWYDLDHLPSPLFASLDTYLKAYKTGEHYFDA